MARQRRVQGYDEVAMPPLSSIVVLVNTRSGTAAARPQIIAELGDRFRAAGADVEIVELAVGQDPAPVARQASTRASVVVAAGGDGTVNGVAAAIVDSPAALGVLPLGTLNHFARDLRIPGDLAQAVAVIVAGRIVRVDVGVVNDALFLNNSSIGLYPNIVDAREALRRDGHAKWPAMAIATFRVLRRYRGVVVTIGADGPRRQWRTPFVFIGNNEYEIDGRRLGERARLDGGRLFAYLAPRLRAYQLPLLTLKALLGRARQSGDFEIASATELWIGLRKQRRLRVALDGEVQMMRTPLHYRIRPGALRVVAPER
jgi:diacylglycerol kinase family enzyme